MEAICQKTLSFSDQVEKHPLVHLWLKFGGNSWTHFLLTREVCEILGKTILFALPASNLTVQELPPTSMIEHRSSNCIRHEQASDNKSVILTTGQTVAMATGGSPCPSLNKPIPEGHTLERSELLSCRRSAWISWQEESNTYQLVGYEWQVHYWVTGTPVSIQAGMFSRESAGPVHSSGSGSRSSSDKPSSRDGRLQAVQDTEDQRHEARLPDSFLCNMHSCHGAELQQNGVSIS